MVDITFHGEFSLEKKREVKEFLKTCADTEIFLISLGSGFGLRTSSELEDDIIASVVYQRMSTGEYIYSCIINQITTGFKEDFEIEEINIYGDDEFYTIELKVYSQLKFNNDLEKWEIVSSARPILQFNLDSDDIKTPCISNEWGGLDEINSVDVPDRFLDIFTLDFIKHPYKASDGISYELEYILAYAENFKRENPRGTSIPSPKKPWEFIETDDNGNLKLTENRKLKEEIENFLHDNPHAYQTNYYMRDPDLNPEGRMDMTGSPLIYY